MPFLLCPGCGKCDLVPLAYSEWILDALSAKGQLDGVAMDQYPGGLSFVLCNDCEKRTEPQAIPLKAGSPASLAENPPDACRKLNSHVAMAGGESVKITRSIQCYTGHSVYLAEMAGEEVCLLHDWLTATTPTAEFRCNADAPGRADEQSDRLPTKKWWQLWK